MEFCMEESCGKCIPCRTGTVQMHRLLNKIINREATADDLAKLAQESVNIVPTQIVGDRMLEDCLVGAQVRTSEFRGRCHRIGYECEHPKGNAFA